MAVTVGTVAKPLPEIVQASDLEYLQRYGYHQAKQSVDTLVSSGQLVGAVRTLQADLGLEPTGVLDQATAEMMTQPRCGNRNEYVNRTKRYALQGTRWSRTELTYDLLAGNSRLSVGQVESAVGEAVRQWESVSNIQFTRVTDNSMRADIQISFQPRDHGDTFPFAAIDLAHAFYPQYGGDIHLSEQEDFDVEKLTQVICHELGHSLGLGHSTKWSVMRPVYAKMPVTEKYVTIDDTRAIQLLYGWKF